MGDVDSVTFVAVSDLLGGGEIFTLRLVEALRESCDAGIAGAAGSPIVERACQIGLRTERLEIGGKLGRRTAVANLLRYPVAARRLNNLVDSRTPTDWVVLQYSWEKLLWRGRSNGARVAVLEHGPIPAPLLRAWPTRRSIRRTLRSCDALLSVGGPSATSSGAIAYRTPVLLHAGVDPVRTEEAVAARDATRGRLAIGRTTELLVFAGRLVPEKGLFELLELAATDDDYHVLIVGSGPSEGELRTAAKELGVSDRLHLTGFVDDPLPYIAAGDAVCLLATGPGEGRPLLALESLAVGTPVVGSLTSPAMAALAAEGHEGIHLVDPSAPHELREVIGVAVSAPRRRIAMPDWTDSAAQLMETLGHQSSGG